MIRIGLYLLALSLLANALLFGLWRHSAGEVARREAVVVKAERDRANKVAGERDQLATDLANVRARLPKAGRTVSDAVHSAPSGCSVSPAVGDSMRQAVRQGVAARRGVGAVPRSN